MQKKLLFNIILLLGVNLLIKPFWILGIDRTFQNMAGYEIYGQYINLFSISMILTMLLDFGINNFNSSTIANDPKTLNSQFASLVPLKLLLSATYLLLTMVVAYLYGIHNQQLGFVLLLALNQILAHFSTFVRSCITGLQYFKTDALLSAVDRLVMILLGLTMIRGYLFELNLFHFILIQTVGYAAVLILGLIILYPHLKSFHITFNTELLRSLLQKTFPYALLAFVMLLYTRSDVLLMKKLLLEGDYENGIFASGGRLLEAANMMVGSTAVIMVPFFARMLSSNSNLSSMSRVLSTVVLVPVCLFTVFCNIYQSEIMQLLSPGSSTYTAEVFGWLILCFIPYGFMYVYGSMLTAAAEMRTMILICTAALIVNLGSNLLLIPFWGAKGAAISALFTHSMVGFGKFVSAIFRLKLQHPFSFYLKFWGFLPFIALTLFYVHDRQFSLHEGLFIGVFQTLLWVILFRMIGMKAEIKRMWQNIASIKSK